MMKMPTTYTIRSTRIRTGTFHDMTGTVEELTKACSYALECGASYEHEKGNSKINRNPKTIKSLISNLNKSGDNAALNGCGSHHYTLVSTNKG